MRKLSIVNDIINTEEILITDENSIPVIICPKSQYRFNYNQFQPPSILVDNFERRRYKDIEIRTIDIDYLNKFGYRFISVKTNSTIRNFPRQTQSYMLESHTRPIPNSIILNKIPKDHFVELDVINNRIRIRGKNCYPYNRSENASPWTLVVKK